MLIAEHSHIFPQGYVSYFLNTIDSCCVMITFSQPWMHNILYLETGSSHRAVVSNFHKSNFVVMVTQGGPKVFWCSRQKMTLAPSCSAFHCLQWLARCLWETNNHCTNGIVLAHMNPNQAAFWHTQPLHMEIIYPPLTTLSFSITDSNPI